MAALNFPNSPSLNDTHTENGVTFKWNGAAWDRLGDIGAQGSAGAQGAAGAAGAAGAQGSTGPVAGSSSQVVYKDGSNNPAGSSSFTFDGTNLTVGGNVSIGGTLTYEDVTNIDSVGLITARNGVDVSTGNFTITENSNVMFQNSARDTNRGAIQFTDGDVFRIRSGALLTEKLRITSSGGVGIGTNNPGSNKLQVQGSSALYGNGGVSATWGDTSYLGALSFDGSAQPVIRAATSKALIFQVNQSTEALRITSAGDATFKYKVSIGDSYGGGEILSLGKSSGTSYMGFINGGTHVGFIGYADQLIVGGASDEFGIRSQQGILFAAGGNSEKMRLNASGYLGVGINNPTNRLHVYSSSDTGEIRLGGGNGPGNHRLFFQAHPSNAYIDSYGNNTHNPLSINADPLILNNSGSGKVLIHTTTSNDNKAYLVVNGTTDSGNIITGRIHDSTNNNNKTVLLFRMNQNQGFQFSGDIIVNSWTGNAKVNCHITVQYQNQNVEVDVVNATHSSQISKSNLRVVTADYGSNRYLGIQKNGGGTGVFYINAFVGTNIDISGNGGIREVANNSLGSVTNVANLN